MADIHRALLYALRRFGYAKEIDWGGKLCYIAPL